MFGWSSFTAKNEHEHLSNVRQVFERLYEAGFELNLKKCFFQLEIKYLSHIIDSKGIKKGNKKVEAILVLRVPRNVSEIGTYLGIKTIMQSLFHI